MNQERRILSAVCVSSFITPFLASSINVAVPAMASEFSVEASQLSWVVTAFLLGSSCMLIPFGRMADILGRKQLFRIGLICVFLTTLGAGFAPGKDILIFLRFLQGVSIAMIFSTGVALLVAAFPSSQRGRVMGYSTAAVYMGLSLGPFLGGAIIHYFGWRMIFFLTAVILLISWKAARGIEGEWYGSRGAVMDYGSSMLYTPGVLSLLMGLSSYGSDWYAPWLLGLGTLLLLLFFLRQHRVSSPLLDISLFRNVIFAMSNLTAFLHYSATFSVSFLLSLYLQVVRGLDEITAGSILLLQPVMMAILSPAAGGLSDKIQPRIIASIGMGITAGGIFSLSLLQGDTSFYMVGGTLLLIGTGFAFFSSPNGNAIMSSVEPKQLGIASSVMAFMRIFGQAMSMTMVTLLLRQYVLQDAGIGYRDSLLQGIQSIFQVFGFICCAGVGISLMRGKQKR